MNWEKKGLIFGPKGEFEWMHSHAQLPVANHIEGEIYRVYFASRTEQQQSHIGFVEFNINDPKRILRISDAPCLSPGPIGCFDQYGVYPSCIIDRGNEKWMYYIGWIRGYESPLFYAAIGLAISKDGGITFERKSSCPIMDRSEFDPCLVTSPHVFKDGDIWRMTYVSGTKWERVNGNLKSFYHIKSATSVDGIVWERNGDIAVDFKDDKESNIARSAVIKEDGLYKMWFSYVTEGLKYRIGYSESKDFVNWKRMDEASGITISKDDFDSNMTCYPNLFSHKQDLFMLYNGNNFGKEGFALAKRII
ncbi:MAG: hypothetical protein P8M05_03700 [Flavobacteriales bacterium]|nr:hypothetical protein [Flavobacteriales bacterium]